MPNIKSAKKKMRQDNVRRKRNEALKNEIKKHLKSIRKASKEQAQAQLKETISLIDKAAKKHIFHKNKAARLKSAISRKLAQK